MLLIGNYNMLQVDDDVNYSAISPGHNTNQFLRLVSFTGPIFVQPDGAPMNCVTYKGFISDHLPLFARFRIKIDND